MKTVETNLYCPERQIQPVSNNGVLEIFHVPEPNQLPIARRQTAQSAGHDGTPIGVGRVVTMSTRLLNIL